MATERDNLKKQLASVQNIIDSLQKVMDRR
jgi:hypothetical protein